MEETQYDNQLVPRGNWFKRNWKWAVPVGCLTFFILFIAFIVGGAFFSLSLSEYNAHETCTHALGTRQCNL